jgi:hypothetical protein
MKNSLKEQNLKNFFIKLFSITLAIIFIISFVYNTILADKIDTVLQVLQLSKKENREIFISKIKLEINKNLSKEKILNDEDAILLKKFIYKIKKEIDDAQ